MLTRILRYDSLSFTNCACCATRELKSLAVTERAREKRLIGSLIVLLSAIAALALAGCSGSPVCESVGNLSVCEPILSFYQQHGGSEVLGYPLSRIEQEDHLMVQYFENAVIEYPALSNVRYDQVNLRSLGVASFSPSAPEAPKDDPECRYFERYGHHVCLAFYDFYVRHGGERVFGQPMSNVIVEDGTRVQYFENAKLVWDSHSTTPHTELADWGKEACDRNGDICVGEPIIAAMEAPSSTPADPVNDVAGQFDSYIAEHGGAAVFGEKIGNLVYAGDVAYQYYSNVALIWTPTSDNPVSLEPLGALDAPEVPSISAPAASDQVHYFPETGHSVTMAFLDFFAAYGGQQPFGFPLTEFRQEDDLAVQWFENVRLEWRPELPDGQRVQLSPLGEINYQRYQGNLPRQETIQETIQEPIPELATQETPPTPPAEFHIKIAPEKPILPAGAPQRVRFLAFDDSTQFLPNIDIVLYVEARNWSKVLTAPPTDANGSAMVDLGQVEGDCGEIIQLRAVCETQDSMLMDSSQFTLWCDSPQ